MSTKELSVREQKSAGKEQFWGVAWMCLVTVEMRQLLADCFTPLLWWRWKPVDDGEERRVSGTTTVSVSAAHNTIAHSEWIEYCIVLYQMADNSGTLYPYTHYVDQAFRQFWKRLASIISVKGGHVEPCVQVFSMTALHCSDINRFQNCPIAW